MDAIAAPESSFKNGLQSPDAPFISNGLSVFLLIGETFGDGRFQPSRAVPPDSLMMRAPVSLTVASQWWWRVVVLY